MFNNIDKYATDLWTTKHDFVACSDKIISANRVMLYYIVMTRDVCFCAHPTVSTLKWFLSNKQLRQFIPSKLFEFIFPILYYYIIVYIRYRRMSHLYISDDRVYSHIPSHEFKYNALLIRLIFVEIIQSLKISTIPNYFFVAS